MFLFKLISLFNCMGSCVCVVVFKICCCVVFVILYLGYVVYASKSYDESIRRFVYFCGMYCLLYEIVIFLLIVIFFNVFIMSVLFLNIICVLGVFE